MHFKLPWSLGPSSVMWSGINSTFSTNGRFNISTITGPQVLLLSLTKIVGLITKGVQEGLNMVEGKSTEVSTPELRSSALRKSVPLWKKSPSVSPRVSLRKSVEKPGGPPPKPEGTGPTGLPGDLQLKASRDVMTSTFPFLKLFFIQICSFQFSVVFLTP